MFEKCHSFRKYLFFNPALKAPARNDPGTSIKVNKMARNSLKVPCIHHEQEQQQHQQKQQARAPLSPGGAGEDGGDSACACEDDRLFRILTSFSFEVEDCLLITEVIWKKTNIHTKYTYNNSWNTLIFASIGCNPYL